MVMTKMFKRHSLAKCVIIGTIITVVLCFLYLHMHWQQHFYFNPNENLTISDILLPWPVSEDTAIVLHSNEFHFLDWRSKNKLDISLSTKLMEISEIIKVPNIDCNALFTGVSLDKAKISTKANRRDSPLNDTVYVNLTEDCERFWSSRGYIMSSLTKEEEEFPIAFSMLVYKDVEMVERLLRAIYRPQNYYCVHVDKKSPETFYKSISAIAGCFPNVFIASQRIDVKWGTFTVLEPELLCMRDLWKYPKWKYFINLTGQEFPLKTNHEIVKILIAYRGASDVNTMFKCAMPERWRGTFPPYGLRPVKGHVHVVLNRHFVDFILHKRVAKELLDWTNTTEMPDETFFAILNANPQLGIKGTYTGTQDGCDLRPTMARYKMWNWNKEPCAGKYVRAICILSIGDLPRLVQVKQMFANKFFLHEDRTVIGCLEEKIFNDTRDEYLRLKTFDVSFYSKLEFVINQIT